TTSGSRQRLAWLRSRFARPVFDSLVLPLAGLFFVLSAQYGAVHKGKALFLCAGRRKRRNPAWTPGFSSIHAGSYQVAAAGVEPAMEESKSSALPLGDGAL